MKIFPNSYSVLNISVRAQSPRRERSDRRERSASRGNCPRAERTSALWNLRRALKGPLFINHQLMMADKTLEDKINRGMKTLMATIEGGKPCDPLPEQNPWPMRNDTKEPIVSEMTSEKLFLQLIQKA